MKIPVAYKNQTAEQAMTYIVRSLDAEYAAWQQLHDYGGYDPHWPDGVHMQRLREEILYNKNAARRLSAENGLEMPEICGRPDPQEVDPEYMARSHEIRFNARKRLAEYEKDPTYRCFLNIEAGCMRIIDRLDTAPVMGNASDLREAIERDDLLLMRLYEHANSRADSVSELEVQDNAAPPQSENVQLSFF